MTSFLKAVRRVGLVIGTAAVLTLPFPTMAQTANFSDSQLKSFAMAVSAINQIAERWQPQVQAAQTEDQKDQMLQQADIEMLQAIENTAGIGVEEYQTIMAAAQTDPALKSQIDTYLQAAGAQ